MGGTVHGGNAGAGAGLVIGGRVLDASALRDLAGNRTVYASAILSAANLVGIVLAVPAAALQEAWADGAADDDPFLDLLLDLPIVVVEDLGAVSAAASGLLGRDVAATGAWDAAAAHTVLVAQQRGWPVLTAAPAPLRALDPGVPLELLPEA